MNYEELEKLVSVPRLNKYLQACNQSQMRAQSLYRANLNISRAFYPLLNIFEVIIRNAINEELRDFFGTYNWIIEQREGFMNDEDLNYSNYFLKRQIDNSITRLQRQRVRLSSSKIVAEQTLGFWISLFETHHYRLLRGTLINCFPYRPRSINRGGLHRKMKRVSKFRNRIYHNEPICFYNGDIDFQKIREIRLDVLDLLSWVSDSAKEFFIEYDGINTEIEIAEKI